VKSDWVQFFELVERLQKVSPGLVELALRYGQSKDREVLQEVEQELGRRSGEEFARESFVDHSQKVNLRRCQDFLAELRHQEDQLRQEQANTAQELSQIQAARREFEKSLKEMLQAESRSFASDRLEELQATEEEVLAGLAELKATGGLELHQFIDELEQKLHSGERNGK
jgi:uncharacterized membrane protein YccC